MQLSPPTQDDLKHGMASRRVGIGRGLTRSPRGETEMERKRQEFVEGNIMREDNTHDTFINPSFLQTANRMKMISRVCVPAPVSQLNEFEDVLCAFDLLLLQPNHLHLLLAILQDP